MDEYLAQEIKENGLDYKIVFNNSKLISLKAKVDEILIADGFQDKIV